MARNFCLLLIFAVSIAEAVYEEETIYNYPKNTDDIDTLFYPTRNDDVIILEFPRCGEATDFKITGLKYKVEAYYSKNGTFGDDYYDFIRFAKVDYEITCKNTLRYKGTKIVTSGVGDWRTYDDDCFGCKGNVDDQIRGWDTLPHFAFTEENGIGTIILNEELDSLIKVHLLTANFFEKIALLTIKDRNILEMDMNKFYRDWSSQKVYVPPQRNLGEKGVLPRPVLLVHGLNSNFKVWGASPVAGAAETDASFKEGLVSRYEQGSLPYMLAMSKNLSMYSDGGTNGESDSINHNGIYFYQSPIDSITEVDVKITWKDDPKSSQSKALFDKLEFVLNAYYGEGKWNKDSTAMIDLVCHSHGGLVVREMLRVLKKNTSYPKGTANPANHIRKIITVNTPHFGTSLAAKNASDVETKFPGLAKIIYDIDYGKTHTLLTMELDVWKTLWEQGSILGILGYGLANIFFPGGILNVAFADEYVKVKGPYLGPYEITVEVEPLFTPNMSFGYDELPGIGGDVKKARKGASDLDSNSVFLRRLNNHVNILDIFPRRPNGSLIKTLPMYSENTQPLLASLLEQISENASRICQYGEKKEGCFLAANIIKNYANTISVKAHNPIINSELWGVLKSFQDDWLPVTDGLVEAESQKFENVGKGFTHDIPELKDYFQKPRTYLMHDKWMPFEPVAHGPVTLEFTKKSIGEAIVVNDGASMQGADLLCALDDAGCDRYADALGVTAFHWLSDGTIEVKGDFDISPQYAAKGYQGVILSSENKPMLLKAAYNPEQGSIISWTEPDGTEQSEVLVKASIVTQPKLIRKGDSITVKFSNYSGKYTSKSFKFSSLPDNLKVKVAVEPGASLAPFIVGKMDVTDPSTQIPPKPPIWHREANPDIVVMHREARDKQETNTSRPRFLIYNKSDKTINGFKIAYYFTADPARQPQIEVDYPQIPAKLEYLGRDKWRVIFNGLNQVIKPKEFAPSKDGWQTRLHYNDWTKYDHFNDYSADYSIGIPQENRKIIVYDSNGNIIWGKEPDLDEDKGLPTAQLSFKDSSPWEKNAFKPEVTVKNTGYAPLQNYHALIYLRFPVNKTPNIPMDNWYTPESVPSLKHLGSNVWALDMYFNKHILYGADSIVEGNIGVHLTDWSKFEKIICGIALKDSSGTVIYGHEPSVKECSEYKTQSLEPAYTMFYRGRFPWRE